ncbi:hypothetical protein [Hymenobacter negativus]|uniref:Uncharacterized protein n=1 Tax=Hymenobacter negativus TaxID=2795026 RepID=A0ABS3Q8Q7_9BACT|nr:hypothetical protein [Hymenobacter negativus]MBO2007646.1 hypothetical protein [Hymenobacter negativus]
MRIKHSLLLGMVAGLASCQQSADVAKTPPSAAAKAVVPPVRRAGTLTDSLLLLAQNRQFANLWLNHASDYSPGVTPMEGFFGADRYRISFAFTQVRPDSLDPGTLLVKGKSRFKKAVVPFSGSLQLRELAHFKRASLVNTSVEDSLLRTYTAKVHFIFRQAPTQPHTGTFEGTGTLEFYITKGGTINFVQTATEAPMDGTLALLYKGKWTEYQTNHHKELLLGRDYEAVGSGVLDTFTIGARGENVNPKYAKLGWDRYWENDEWWTAAGGSASKNQQQPSPPLRMDPR